MHTQPILGRIFAARCPLSPCLDGRTSTAITQTTSAGSRDARLFRSRLYRLLFDKDLEAFGVTAICLNDTGNRFADGFQNDYS